MPDIEEQIRRAMQEGKFNDLPGKGKPLKLEDNPHANPEWQMAFHILRDAGFSLLWIESLKEIETDAEAVREGLRQAWAWRRQAETEGQSRELIQHEWNRAVQRFQEQVTALNKSIKKVNLEVPNARFQRPLLDVGREIRRVEDEM